MQTNVTDMLLSTTRAVRKRLDFERPVEPEIIVECLRLAVQSPTMSNSQKWHWIVITDPEQRLAIKRFYGSTGRPYLEQLARESPNPEKRRVYDSALFLLDNLERVPVHVIPCLEGRITTTSNFHAATFYGSILPAVWSFMLALRARGLGSAWTTMHLNREDAVAEMLGIPDGISQVALIPVAYTLGTEFKPASRPPVEEITYWGRWGATHVRETA